MNNQFFYHTALVTHIIGISLMAGTTLISFISLRHFWQEYALDKARAMLVIRTVSKFQMLNAIGIILLIVSGITMMGITHGVFGEQLWFRIKFALVLTVIVNGFGIGRRQGGKLRKLLMAPTPAPNTETTLLKIKNNMRLFFTVQLALFLVIFTLSVFKFN